MSATTVHVHPWTGRGLAGPPAVAAHLSISLRHFEVINRDGRFGPTGTRLGRTVRFSQAEVDAWIAAGMPRREIWAALWADQQQGKKGRGR